MEIDEAERTYWDGCEQMKRGLWGDAADTFCRAERLGYRSAMLPVNLGEALVRSGQLERATVAYEEAVAQDPWHIGGERGRAYMLCFLGLSLWRQGRNEEARRQVLDALHIAPGLVEAQAALALILNALGRVEESAAAFAATLALLPTYLERWPVAFEGDFFYDIESAREVHAAVSGGRQWPGSAGAADQEHAAGRESSRARRS
jgi:tetratricopeptide (TPR) repeat protein